MTESNPYRPPQSEIDHAARKTVHVPTGVAWRFILAVGIIASLVGLFSRHFRPMFNGPVHYEMIVALFLQISLVLTALVAFRRRQLRDGILNVNLAIAAVWGAFLVGWTIKHEGLWGDLVGMTVVFWFGSTTIGSLSIYAFHLIRTKSISKTQS